MKRSHPFLKSCEAIFARQPGRWIKGVASAYIAYPIAQRREQRDVTSKLRELRHHYRLPKSQRMDIARGKLADIVAFAGHSVPYYRDLFATLKFDPAKLKADTAYLNDLPLLTKDIIREQGDRLLSSPLQGLRHYSCKTGGSTGLSTVIEYDQLAADYSSAVTLYCRESVGNTKRQPELHFACRFPDADYESWPTREDFKCFAMNRSNIFFDRLDDAGLEEIWQTLKARKPYMVHGHPSTIYALACYIERTQGKARAFDVFEPSGELLEPYQRDKIAQALQCRVVNRYGLAELGVMAYELDGKPGMRVLESEGWPESIPGEHGHELIFTGFRNRLMPLIRYQTGDLAEVEAGERGFVLNNVVGRIHDVVTLDGVDYATHTIQDMLDHRVGGIQEFQIDVRGGKPLLKIVPEGHVDPEHISAKVNQYWGTAFDLQFVGHSDFVRVGRHAKFRHVVTQ
ncbi:phenylacetate--CoA ligase family protein [Pseudomaricurvus sp. HS19]|uniref:phenylacetate--CoA ligase family protein n=1 Tax=Pseudomaricurvus sp. HS19 TaxID=2692626 RepID=UPI001371E5FE|nr:phenylacetate--CoA ligase family protein [Pseudomaricurvus sp. HS19]MYM62874.1 phenylacetate--CoA ligase family protein [Pseudomaricurvus sp. HS19]